MCKEELLQRVPVELGLKLRLRVMIIKAIDRSITALILRVIYRCVLIGTYSSILTNQFLSHIFLSSTGKNFDFSLGGV